MNESPGMIQAALFDLDGVVVYSDQFHYRAWKRLADEQGWAFDEQVNEGCKGVPRMASLEVILRHNRITLPDAKKEELAERKNRAYVASLDEINESALVPGVRDFLNFLAARGTPLGLCSSSKNAALILDRLALTPLFATVVTGHDIKRPKPDPEIFLKGAAGCGVEPGRAVVFEDAASGIEAALGAGCRVIGVGKPDDLPGAELHIADFREPALAGLFA